MFRTAFPSIIRSSRLHIQQEAYVKQLLLPAASGDEMELQFVGVAAYIYIYIYIYIYMQPRYIYMYVCVRIYIYIYIYICSHVTELTTTMYFN